MKPFFTISCDDSGFYFSLFYLLAFFSCIVTIFIIGIKRKYPIEQFLTVIASGVIFFIIGNKLFAFSPEEWKQLLTEFHLPNTGRKTVLGGLIGLIFGLWMSKNILRAQFPIFKGLALALPVSMAIQRVGCLMAGCCYGLPTDVPWGIAYSNNSIPFHSHVNQGLINPTETSSLIIHPTQIYQILFCLLIAFVVWKTSSKWKSEWNILLFSIFLYGFFRFFSEFFRDPNANAYAGQYFMGLKYAQWFIIAGCTMLISVIIIKERLGRKQQCDTAIRGKILQHSIYIFLIVMILLISKNFFNPIEIITILLTLIPAIISVGWVIYKKFTVQYYRWVIPLVLLLSLGLMSQVYFPENQDEKITFSEIGIGGMLAQYYEHVKQYSGTYYDPCTGVSSPIWSDPETHLYNSKIIGLQYAYKERKPNNKKFSFYSSGFFTMDHVVGKSSSSDIKEKTFGFSEFMQWDWNWIGFGVGIQIGKFRLAQRNKNANKFEIGESDNAANEFYLIPQSMIRAGPSKIAFMEINIANFFPSNSPMPSSMIGVGTGLGKVNGTKITLGGSDAGYYFHGVYPIKEKYVISAFCASNFKKHYEARYAISLGFQYRFNYVVRSVKSNKKK